MLKNISLAKKLGKGHNIVARQTKLELLVDCCYFNQSSCDHLLEYETTARITGHCRFFDRARIEVKSTDKLTITIKTNSRFKTV